MYPIKLVRQWVEDLSLENEVGYILLLLKLNDFV
jgi:hypothetical protein